MKTGKGLFFFFALILCARMSGVLRADGFKSIPLSAYVNPFIGTKPGAPDFGIGNSTGDTFPGAVTPFGMVEFSPDTSIVNPGGYIYSDGKIQGFSLTHFSGRGIQCWMDFPILPKVGGALDQARKAQSFSHVNEAASPGYYRVKLDDSQVLTELTATARTGFAKFTFPASQDSVIQVDTRSDSMSGKGGSLRMEAPAALSGEASASGCGGYGISYKVYFYAEFDRPLASSKVWETGSGNFVFDTSKNSTVQMKIGVSFVSRENARLNLEVENPNWDFASVREKAAEQWNSELGALTVSGGSDDEKAVFYTSLYHSLIHPNIFSDANGEYLGFDQQVHPLPTGRVRYHNFSAWDNYRTEMPLLAVVAPARMSDMMESLVGMSREDLRVRPMGGGLPRWQQASSNSCGMEGDPQDDVIATAYAFGVDDFDTLGALNAMKRGASIPHTTSGGCEVREDLEAWMNLGYVPENGSRNLQYANDDFAISQFASALGDFTARDYYLSRSQNWKKIFNPANGGSFVPKDQKGNFVSGFSPLCSNDCGFMESDSDQYEWLVPFDYPGLFQMMGGTKAVVARLDQHFFDARGNLMLNEGPHSPFAFIGNEPESEAPYAYTFAGAPEKTQRIVRSIVLNSFKNSPSGMPGNDDGGAMGSWYVWGAIGLRPLIPGVGGFVVSSPLFESVQIRLKNGKTLLVHSNASDKNMYVRNVTLNGQAFNPSWLDWSSLENGGVLELELSDSPDSPY